MENNNTIKSTIKYFWVWKKRGKNQREKLHPTPFETKKDVEKDLYFNSGILKKDIEYVVKVNGCWIGNNEQEDGSE